MLWFCLVHESQDDDEVGGMGKSWDFAWLLLLLHQLYITDSGSSFINSVIIVAVVVFFLSVLYTWAGGHLVPSSSRCTLKHFLNTWCKPFLECFVFRDVELPFCLFTWL